MLSSSVLFAIEAGVRLGRKVQDVLIEETADRALSLPLGDLFANVPEQDADFYFNLDQNFPLIDDGGPYHGLTGDDLVRAYRIQLGVAESLDPAGALGTDPTAVVLGLRRIEQAKKGQGPKPVVQRILGTLVEIGVDYFAAHPEALGRDSDARKIVSALVEGLDDTDFAEGEGRAIFGDLLNAALHTLVANVALIGDDRKLQALLGGVSKTLIADVQSAGSEAAKIRREDLFRRIGSSILRGAATAFAGDLGLFMPHDDAARALVQSTLTQVLAGIDGREDLFSGESLELLFQSALTAAAENAELFSSDEIVREMLSRCLGELSSAQGRRLFSSETVAAVLQQALEVVGENAETLVDASKPHKQLLASTLGAVISSLTRQLAGNGEIEALLSKRQVVELARIAFEAVAQHPEQLLGDDLDESKKNALAQVIASVARALGDDPGRLITGRGFLELVRIALDVALQNLDQLIDFDTQTPRRNALFQAIAQIVEALDNAEDSRHLITRAVFLEIVERVLPVVSANLEAFLDAAEPLREVVEKALELARGALAGRINGANLVVLIEGLLLEVLWDELDVQEAAAVKRAAEEILRAA